MQNAYTTSIYGERSMHELILIFVLHYVADFWFQTDKQAVTKSYDNKNLATHAFTYALPFVIISPLYALVNGLLHLVTDYFTSRWSSYYYKQNDMRKFFKVVGLDQMVHAVTLISTYMWLI